MTNRTTAAPRQGNQTAAPTPTQAYTILVKVYAPTQADAFGIVEDAIDSYVGRRPADEPLSIHVSTQDGTRATQF